jgi:hypothetical protein
MILEKVLLISEEFKFWLCYSLLGLIRRISNVYEKFQLYFNFRQLTRLTKINEQ